MRSLQRLRLLFDRLLSWLSALSHSVDTHNRVRLLERFVDSQQARIAILTQAVEAHDHLAARLEQLGQAHSELHQRLLVFESMAQAHLAELTQDLQATLAAHSRASARERHDRYDRLQTRIDRLQAQLASLRGVETMSEREGGRASSEPLRFADPPVQSIPADPGNAHLVLQPYTLLHVGPFVPSRAPTDLIDVLAVLAEFGEDNLRLILAGPAGSADDPGILEMLTHQAAGLGLSDQVHLRPGCSEAELARCYLEADLYLAMDDAGDSRAVERAIHHDRLVLVYGPSDRGDVWPARTRLAPLAPSALAGRIRELMQDAGLRQAQLAAQRAWLGAPQSCERLSIRIEGPYDSTYSLALVNSAIARALRARGDRVSLLSTDGFGDNRPSKRFLRANPDLDAMRRRQPRRVDVTLRNLYPPRTNALSGLLRVLGPYGWEESGFPRDWIQGFNRRLSGVLCVSDYVREVLIANGLRVPAVTTGNVADGLLGHAPRAPGFALPSGYRLLHISSGFPRKGIDRLLAVLERLPSEATLIVKTFPNPHNDVARQLHDLGYRSRPVAQRAVTPEAGPATVTRWRQGGRHVLLIDADLPPEQIVWLYRQCDLLVAPSRGEGFGLPMAEAMLFDVPVVTTDSGGQRDFCTPETAWLVRSRQVAARTHFALPGSCWAEPDAESLHEAILAVMNATPEERAVRTERAGALIRNRYNARAVAERIHAALGRFGAAD